MAIILSLSIGLTAGYLLFNTPQTALIEQESSTVDLSETLADSIDTSSITQLQVGDSINQETLDGLNNLIKNQKLKIAELKAKLSQTASKGETTSDEPAAPSKLEVIAMADFESMIENQFYDRFRGYAIEVEGEELNRMISGFQRSTSKADWSEKYEQEINDFLYQSDTGNIHFVDLLSCNNYMCRLNILTDEPEQWQNIVYSLAQQPWFESVLMKEKTDDPTVYNYFIMAPLFSR